MNELSKLTLLDETEVYLRDDAALHEVSKEIEGNPITFADGADAPLVECTTQITGSQDLHGYDKPWVGGAGVNLLNTDGTDTTNGYKNHYFLSSNGNETANSSYNISEYFSVVADNEYTYCAYPNTSGGSIGMCFYDSSKQYISGIAIGNGTATATAPSNAAYCRATFESEINTTYKLLVCKGSTKPSSYSPYSNICPITAYTEGEIEVRGKNEAESFYVGTTLLRYSESLFIEADLKPSTNYTISFKTTSVGNIYYSNENLGTFKTLTVVNGYNKITVKTVSNLSRSNTSQYKPGKGWCFLKNHIAEPVAINFSDVMLVEGSTDSPYEPYAAATHTIDLDGTRYRGTLDVVRGKMSVTHKVVNLGDYAWTYDSQYQRFQHSFTDMKEYAPRTNEMVCSALEVISDGRAIGNVPDYSVYSGSIVVNVTYLSFGSDTESFRAAMNGVQLVYELATPIEVDLTPTAIRTLSGYNHIESSTGDLSVEYITEDYEPLLETTKKQIYEELPFTIKNGKLHVIYNK